MSLKGNLQSVDLANVLQMLSINQKEGTLVLFDGDTRKSIYFSRDGVSMLSRGRRGQDTLGRILLRYGRVNPEMLERALEASRTQGKRLGEALVEMGFVSEADVDDAVRTQIEEEIYNLFIWKEASFEFIEGPPPGAGEAAPPRVTFNVNSLIMEAQRRADEWNHIRGVVPSLDEIYKPTEKLQEAVVTDEVFHFPFAPKVLELLQQGRRNVHELIEGSHAAKFEACKILSLLLEQGAVEPVSIADLQAYAQKSSARGDHAQAAKFLSRVVDLGGATPSVNMSLGYALESIDEPERASVHFKAAAEAYVEAMESKSAYEALVRVARALPTDLPAVTQLVEMACNDEEILAANRHEVVETGRVLAQCLRELGRLPAAIQVLNKLAQVSSGDLTLRSMLVQAYQDASLNNEAMVELEAMAELCLKQKNYDEAIRCYRRVLSIDRNRPNILKKIEALTHQRDAGKRLVLKVVAGVAVLGSVGAAAWGFLFLQRQRFEEQERTNDAISKVLDPLVARFAAADKEYWKAKQGLEDWRSALPATVIADWQKMERQADLLKATLEETRAKATDLYTQHGSKGGLSDTFVTDRTNTMQVRVRAVEEERKNLRDGIREAQEDDFSSLNEEILVRPLAGIPRAKRILLLLEGIGVPTEIVLKGRAIDVVDFAARLERYKGELSRVQLDANRLWDEGRRADSHELLARYLGELSTVVEFAEILRFRLQLTSVPEKAQVRILQGPGANGPPLSLPRALEYSAAEGIRYEIFAEGFRTAKGGMAALKPPFLEVELKALPLEDRVVLTKVPVWTTTLGAGGVDAPAVPTPDGKFAVVADRSGWIHLLSLADGRKAASYDARSPSGFPGGVVVTADTVYAASADGEGVIVALELPSLKERWKKSGEEGAGAVYGTPLLHEGTLLVAGESGIVKALDPSNGALVWEARLPAGTRQPVLAARGWFVVYGEDGVAWAIAPGVESIVVLPTPREQGSYAPPRCRPLASGDKILFGPEGAGSEFSWVELPVPGAASPHIGYRWGVKRDAAEPSGAVLSGPEEALLLFTDGFLLRASLRAGARPGEPPRRVLPEKEKPVGGPVLAGSLLILASEHGMTAVKRAGDLAEAWRWTASEDSVITTPPVVCGKLVLVGTREGKVQALLVE